MCLNDDFINQVLYLPCSRLVPAGGSAEPQGCASHQAPNDYKACSPGRENDLAQPTASSCILPKIRERNPGNYFANNTNPQ